MKKISKKMRRQHALRQLIQDKEISTQEDLKIELIKMGIEITQSSLSRDLNDIGIIKRRGTYQLLNTTHPAGMLPPITSMLWAGVNILVVKTHPSMAPSLGSLIDEQNLPEVVGTVSGDDTVFIATHPEIDKKTLEKKLTRFFN